MKHLKTIITFLEDDDYFHVQFVPHHDGKKQLTLYKNERAIYYNQNYSGAMDARSARNIIEQATGKNCSPV